ncbi:MAG: hypothetical protein HC899_39165 [Leptolyngbyaceae cyanobacterium SM1_4_3]|nr:hypothetical protein [Leptolyngbyaceae cyanobacterium SM1_4_3]
MQLNSWKPYSLVEQASCLLDWTGKMPIPQEARKSCPLCRDDIFVGAFSDRAYRDNPVTVRCGVTERTLRDPGAILMHEPVLPG